MSILETIRRKVFGVRPDLDPQHQHKFVPMRRGFPQVMCRCGLIGVRGVKSGENSISVGNGSVDIIRWSASQAPLAAGDIGMDTATGRIRQFRGGVARDVADLGDLAGSGVIAVGSPSITRMEPISLAGPASYVTGGFTATFANLTTVERALIALRSAAGTAAIFVIVAKSGNTVTIRAYKGLRAHTHTFSGSPHTHTITMNSHTHSLTMNSHTHGITVVAGSGGLGVSCSTTQFLVPVGNPSRTIDTNGTTSTGTVGGTVSTGSNSSTAAAGTNASTEDNQMEEVAAATNLSGTTLELLGFGT